MSLSIADELKDYDWKAEVFPNHSFWILSTLEMKCLLKITSGNYKY